MCPGCAFASAISSCTDFAGKPELTTTIRLTAARLASAAHSYAKFLLKLGEQKVASYEIDSNVSLGEASNAY
jgi:hypothetical protein